MNPHLTNKGSSPSPGAHLWESSTCFKTDGCKRETKALKVKMRRQQRMNAAASFNDTAVVTALSQEKQAKTERQEDYESLDHVIDLITRDFSRIAI